LRAISAFGHYGSKVFAEEVVVITFGGSRSMAIAYAMRVASIGDCVPLSFGCYDW
jgi:hypothetical protein